MVPGLWDPIYGFAVLHHQAPDPHRRLPPRQPWSREEFEAEFGSGAELSIGDWSDYVYWEGEGEYE